MNSRIAALLAATALSASLAACGESGSAGEATGDPARPSEAGDIGDALALGQRAVSPFVDYGGREQQTKVGVRVLGVRKGRNADLKDFDLDRKHRRSVPYYVDAKFENLGSFALSRNLLRASVEDQTGREYRPSTLDRARRDVQALPGGQRKQAAPGRELHRLLGGPAAQGRRARPRALPGRRDQGPPVLAIELIERTSP